MIANTDYILPWKSKGLSDESIRPPTEFDNSTNPKLNYYGNKIRVKFIGGCLNFIHSWKNSKHLHCL